MLFGVKKGNYMELLLYIIVIIINSYHIMVIITIIINYYYYHYYYWLYINYPNNTPVFYWACDVCWIILQ